ncbi:MAG: FAD-linked oxidase C-terminal domain-containing protein [Desulfobacteraceae bacterium]
MAIKTDQATQALVHDLSAAIRGEVRFDHLTRRLYSTDASDYCKLPVGVVIPREVDDIRAAMEISARHQTATIPRGGGSNLSGQTVGTGLVLDHSKYLNRILEINPEEQWVRVESGVVLDVLNAALASHNLMVGPDPSSGSVATMGGMAGNNSTGSHSFRYGMMADHILEMEVVLSDGSKVLLDGKETATMEALSRKNSLEGGLYREIPALIDAHAEEIRKGYPGTWRNVAGYGLNRLLAARDGGSTFNLAPLIAGSEGTLAVITALKLRLVPRPAAVNLMILHFSQVDQALEMVPAILEHQPAAVELMTAPSIMLADGHPAFRPRLRRFVQGNPGAVLIVEFAEMAQKELAHRIEAFKTWLGRSHCGEPIIHCVTPEQVDNVWQIRKAVFGLLLSKPGDDKPIWIIDDATVPVDRLTGYTRDVVAAGRRHGIDINFDAHASAGCLHMGLDVNLKTHAGLRLLELLSKEIMAIAIAHDGTTTGEHGEGLARSYFNEHLYGPRLHQAFRSVKAAFDPENRLNPHKVVDPIEPWNTGWLRYHPGYRTPLAPAKTHLDFNDFGGYAGLVEMCNGMGVCRSQVAGTMCPSYRVTKDELDTTRGRANILRAAITGELGPAGLADEAVYKALELCLECKACRNECGSKVDMAKLKYEFLAHYQERHGTPLRSRMFGHLALADAVAGRAPHLANRIFRSSAFRNLLHRTVKIDRRRELPLLAAESFQQWFRRHIPPEAAPRGEIVLWDDCHLSFHEPGIGVAAVKVLEAAGFRVKLIKGRRCCGRPLISKGMLKQARANARHNLHRLREVAEQGVPIIGVEPSCIACFRDEYPSLVKGETADRVAVQAFFFEEFITDLAARGELDLPFDPARPPATIKVHTHCYQKALGTADKVLAMLRLVPNATVEAIDSGCCGMAGAFGYEKEHYDISMAIGELALFPVVRAAAVETIIAAAGTSCRTQIKDGTRRKARHPIEIVADAISY